MELKHLGTVIPGDTGPGGPHAASQAGQFAFSDKTCKVKVSQGKTVLQWGPVRHLPRDLASQMSGEKNVCLFLFLHPWKRRQFSGLVSASLNFFRLANPCHSNTSSCKHP